MGPRLLIAGFLTASLGEALRDNLERMKCVRVNHGFCHSCGIHNGDEAASAVGDPLGLAMACDARILALVAWSIRRELWPTQALMRLALGTAGCIHHSSGPLPPSKSRRQVGRTELFSASSGLAALPSVLSCMDSKTYEEEDCGDMA